MDRVVATFRGSDGIRTAGIIGLGESDASDAMLVAERSRDVEQGPFFQFNFVASAPEPATMGLIGVGTIAILLRRRRR